MIAINPEHEYAVDRARERARARREKNREIASNVLRLLDQLSEGDLSKGAARTITTTVRRKAGLYRRRK